jgi:hypothetical protein
MIRATRLNSDKWYEQSDEDGYLFVDKYVHPECEYIETWDSYEDFHDDMLNRLWVRYPKSEVKDGV